MNQTMDHMRGGQKPQQQPLHQNMNHWITCAVVKNRNNNRSINGSHHQPHHAMGHTMDQIMNHTIWRRASTAHRHTTHGYRNLSGIGLNEFGGMYANTATRASKQAESLEREDQIITEYLTKWKLNHAVVKKPQPLHQKTATCGSRHESNPPCRIYRGYWFFDYFNWIGIPRAGSIICGGFAS